MKTKHYITINMNDGSWLTNIKKQYYQLLESETSEDGCASTAQVLEWAKLKGYKFIAVYKDEFIFEILDN